MKTKLLEDAIWVPAPIDDVFPFFSRPENLGELTPPELGFEILTPEPVPMHEGALIDYRITLGPFPMRWRTLISTYEPPHRFVDEQLRGPYASWRHEHLFTARDGGSEIRDTVRYAMPMGPLGDLVHKYVVAGRLERIFAYRRETVRRLFERESR